MGRDLRIKITNNFDATKIFRGMRFYSRGKHNESKVSYEIRQTKDEPWEEDVYTFPGLGKTQLVFEPSGKTSERGLKEHELTIRLFGARKYHILKRLEGITGIDIKKYESEGRDS